MKGESGERVAGEERGEGGRVGKEGKRGEDTLHGIYSGATLCITSRTIVIGEWCSGRSNVI